jgi:hypothetical protein
MHAISTAIVALFTMITTLCSAGNRAASALDNLASVAENASGEYKDQSEYDRETRRIQRQRDRELHRQQLLQQEKPSALTNQVLST